MLVSMSKAGENLLSVAEESSATSSHSLLYSSLPSLDTLLRQPALLALASTEPRVLVVSTTRRILLRIREEIASGRHTAATLETLLERVAEIVMAEIHIPYSLRPVLNATGVILHTNMGRAPLSPRAVAHVARVAGGYSNLEFDLATGRRGHRDQHAEPLLLRLLAASADQPAEDAATTHAALVVNNCAAATILALNTLADGGEVLVSRGELVEIGGGFRVPDILRKSGAVLREVGTTNRTRVADYAEAITPATRLILRVHQSNFRIEGFTERPSLRELIDLGQAQGVPVFEDQGTGLVTSLEEIGIREESSFAESFRQGADLVAASGDKLMGGPQCGLIIGRRNLVDQLRRNPFYRAFRVDKMTYAALEATLLDYLDRREESVPILGVMRTAPEDLRMRCENLVAALSGNTFEAQVVEAKSVLGGGTTPGATLASYAISLRHDSFSAESLLAALREEDPPLIGRVQEDRVLLDLRTIPTEEDSVILRILQSVAEQPLAEKAQP